ncbi:hypothetical protein RHO12_03210 [Orbus sturtevantii]|uniref:hypothetical protein n=1 Tax=Orbus sturtevantii TaxID=3074109 RepID=UPI00370DC40B
MTNLTQGQKLVGLAFNPSGDDKVTRFKQAIASAIDILQEGGTNEGYKEHSKNLAVDTLIVGQMLGVKSITWKE